MNRSTGTPAPEPPPSPAGRADPDQLTLRLLAWVEGCRSTPPERALWRELLDLAIRGAPDTVFMVHSRRISRATVHHVALGLYMLSDRSGIAHVTNVDIATQLRRDLKSVTRSVTILNRIYIIRSTRDTRRGARCHSMNIGGLAWPTVRHRAKSYHQKQPAAAAAPRLPLEPSGGLEPPLSGGLEPPLRGLVRTGGLTDQVIPPKPPRTAGGPRPTRRVRRQTGGYVPGPRLAKCRCGTTFERTAEDAGEDRCPACRTKSRSSAG